MAEDGRCVRPGPGCLSPSSEHYTLAILHSATLCARSLCLDSAPCSPPTRGTSAKLPAGKLLFAAPVHLHLPAPLGTPAKTFFFFFFCSLVSLVKESVRHSSKDASSRDAMVRIVKKLHVLTGDPHPNVSQAARASLGALGISVRMPLYARFLRAGTMVTPPHPSPRS